MTITAIANRGLDHSTLSPSGRVSKRARNAALKRAAVDIFGTEGLQPPQCTQPTERESYLRQAAQLRDLAARGMSVRKYTREAERLEALAGKAVA